MPKRRPKQFLQCVTYRIPPDVDEAITELAEREEDYINPTVIRLLRFALAHIDCTATDSPTFAQCNAAG